MNIKIDFLNNKLFFLLLIVLLVGFTCIGSAFATNIDDSDNNCLNIDDGVSINTTNLKDNDVVKDINSDKIMENHNDSNVNNTSDLKEITPKNVNNSYNINTPNTIVDNVDDSNSYNEWDGSNIILDKNHTMISFNNQTYNLTTLLNNCIINEYYLLEDNQTTFTYIINNDTLHYAYNLNFIFLKYIPKENLFTEENIHFIKHYSQILVDGNYINPDKTWEYNGTKVSLCKNLIINNETDYWAAKNISKDRIHVLGQYDNFIPNSRKDYVLNIVFNNFLNINDTDGWSINKDGFNIIKIMGNNSIINGKGGSSKNYHFAIVQEGCALHLDNLTITNYNTAIVNEGDLVVHNCKFDNNKIYYIFNNKDKGGAIMNNNHAIFVNTIFTNDFSALGGAIYNSGYLELNYCNFNNNSEVTGLSHKNNDVFNYAPENVLNIDHCGNITVKQEKKPSVVKQALMNGVGVGLFVTSTVAISTILAPASVGLSFIGYVGCGALSGFVFGAGCAGYSYMSSHDSHYDLWSEQTLEIVLSNTLAGASGATVGYGLGKIGTILKNIKTGETNKGINKEVINTENKELNDIKDIRENKNIEENKELNDIKDIRENKI